MSPLSWTREMDAKLEELWPDYSCPEIGKIMGLNYWNVQSRGRKLRLPKRDRSRCFEPAAEIWVQTATRQAKLAGVDPGLVLGGGRTKPIVLARWAAFKATLDNHPEISIGGLARVSGFDHAAILHGLKRLSGASASQCIFAGRATGRRPTSVLMEAAE